MPATLWSLRMCRLSAPLRLVISCSLNKMNAITPVSRDDGRKLNQGVIAFFCLMNKVVALNRRTSEESCLFVNERQGPLLYLLNT